MPGINLERAKRACAQAEAKGVFATEEAYQLIEAGIPVFDYVSFVSVDAGDEEAVPDKVREIIKAAEESAG